MSKKTSIKKAEFELALHKWIFLGVSVLLIFTGFTGNGSSAAVGAILLLFMASRGFFNQPDKIIINEMERLKSLNKDELLKASQTTFLTPEERGEVK